MSLKMYDEALKIYQKVIELEEDNELARYCIGLILGLLGQYKESLPYFDAYISARGEDMNAVAERAIIYYHLGELVKAQEEMKRVLKKEKDHPMYMQVMAYMER